MVFIKNVFIAQAFSHIVEVGPLLSQHGHCRNLILSYRFSSTIAIDKVMSGPLGQSVLSASPHVQLTQTVPARTIAFLTLPKSRYELHKPPLSIATVGAST